DDALLAGAVALLEPAPPTSARWQGLSDSCRSPASSSETMRLHLARAISFVPESDRHERSEEEAGFLFRWVDIDEAVDAVVDGRITNAIAQLAILQVSRVLRAEAEGRSVDLRPVDAPRRLVD